MNKNSSALTVLLIGLSLTSYPSMGIAHSKQNNATASAAASQLAGRHASDKTTSPFEDPAGRVQSARFSNVSSDDASAKQKKAQNAEKKDHK